MKLIKTILLSLLLVCSYTPIGISQSKQAPAGGPTPVAQSQAAPAGQLYLPLLQELEKKLTDIELRVTDANQKLDELNSAKPKPEAAQSVAPNSAFDWVLIGLIVFCLVGGLCLLVWGLISWRRQAREQLFGAIERAGRASSAELIRMENTLAELSKKSKRAQDSLDILMQLHSKIAQIQSGSADRSTQISPPQPLQIGQEQIRQAFDASLIAWNAREPIQSWRERGVIAVCKSNSSSDLVHDDTKSIEECDFWALPAGGSIYVLLPSLYLRKQAANLVADDSRQARLILEGIFQFELGASFEVRMPAELRLENSGYRVMRPGVLTLPGTPG